jgi:hypothetical protein
MDSVSKIRNAEYALRMNLATHPLSKCGRYNRFQLYPIDLLPLTVSYVFRPRGSEMLYWIVFGYLWFVGVNIPHSLVVVN